MSKQGSRCWWSSKQIFNLGPKMQFIFNKTITLIPPRGAGPPPKLEVRWLLSVWWTAWPLKDVSNQRTYMAWTKLNGFGLTVYLDQPFQYTWAVISPSVGTPMIIRLISPPPAAPSGQAHHHTNPNPIQSNPIRLPQWIEMSTKFEPHRVP